MKMSHISLQIEYHGCYTIIATNMQYFSSMPSVSFLLDHTRLDKDEGSTEEEQCTSTRQMYQVTDVALCEA